MTTTYKIKTRRAMPPFEQSRSVVVIRETTTTFMEVLNDQGIWEPIESYQLIENRQMLAIEEN